MAGRVQLASLVVAVMAVSHVSAFYLNTLYTAPLVVPPLTPLFGVGGLGVGGLGAGGALSDQIPRRVGPNRPFMATDAIPGALSQANGIFLDNAAYPYDGMGGGIGLLGGDNFVDPMIDTMDVGMVGGVGVGGLGGAMVGGF